MYKILVADNDITSLESLKNLAELDGNKIYHAVNGIQAVKMCRESRFDIVIVDIMLNELNGLSVIKEIRKASDTPIIVVSTINDEYHRISAFEFGADDYVVKPFSSKELMLRIEAILRRVKSASKSGEIKHKIFTYKGISIDYDARIVTVDGVRKNFSPKEFELFSFLIANKNIAVKRERLISDVWGYDFYGDDRTLDTHIKLLRKLLAPYDKLIVTVRSVGYRFECDM